MVDPEREVDLVRELSIIGKVGELGVINAILPVVSMGSVVQQTVEVRQPSFRTTDIFSAGVQTAPVVNDLLATTGQLAEGIFDCVFYCAGEAAGAKVNLQYRHRNAANNGNVAVWDNLFSNSVAGNTDRVAATYYALEVALNEQLQIIVQENNAVAASVWNGVIFARRRT